MPTPEEIKAYQSLRARFMNAVYDERARSHTGIEGVVLVPRVLDQIGARDLDEHAITLLVSELIDDGLINEFAPTEEAPYPEEIRLTSSGRLEVQQWITDDAPTEHLELPPSQVINTTNHFHGPVSGAAFVTASPGATVNVTTVGESLAVVVDKARELFASWQGSPDEREEVEADLDILTDEGTSGAPRVGRVRSALRRIDAWALAAVSSGGTQAVTDEVHTLVQHVLQTL